MIPKVDGRLVFISVSQALLGDQSLTLPLPDVKFEGAIDLQSDGILDDVLVVPLSSTDVSGSLLNRQRVSNNMTPFCHFGFIDRNTFLNFFRRLSQH